MSRVNYPKQRQIDRQIQAIIKNSGMFEDDLTYNGFTELKPIQKKNDKIIRLLKTASSIAAIVSLIVLVDFMRKPIKNTVQPLKSCESVLDENQSKSKAESYLINDSIELEYMTFSEDVEYKNNNAKQIQFILNNLSYTDYGLNKYDTDNCGRLECTYPTVKYNNAQDSTKKLYIEEYYTNIIETLENNIRIEYLKGIFKGMNCYTTIKYHVQSMDSINEKLVTFIAQEEVVNEYSDITRYYNNVYARTFDIETGEPIELNKLFNEPVQSMDYIYNRLDVFYANSFEQSINELMDTNEMSDLYYNTDGESNWYLTSEGIVFLINNMYYNSGAEGKTQNLDSGSVLISYSDFYNQGLSFNSAYINYLPQ